jgi:hypothetical protein
VASRRRRAVTDALTRTVERAMGRLELRTYQALTSASPVRTGFFRAGWSPSTTAPQPGPRAPASGARGVPREQLDQIAREQAAALFGRNNQKAQEIARAYRLSQGAVFIVNAVHYGVYLNAGSSAQAPAMFVEMAIATAVRATAAELRR